jgi:glutamine amidotransferase-like uncharacterized protein
MDFKNSPNSNEAAHLAAGVYSWQSGRFGLYPVNPPLVRMLAALPVVCANPKTDWQKYQMGEYSEKADARPEFSLGIGFVRDNRERAQRLFAWARWLCLPLSVFGGYICWRWACELYGAAAGIVALALWCFSPNVLAWSATIGPDAAAAAFGVAAGYFFWRWLRCPDGFGALVAGILLGLALLSKMTWLVAVALWPAVWLFWLWASRLTAVSVGVRRQFAQLVGVLAVAFLVVNLGYTFEGTLTRLGKFTFVSHLLAGEDSTADGGRGGNRFAEGWLRNVPVPLPKSYVQGIDLQKLDFERGLPSYLSGRWKQHGWWYYYAVCAALKVPLGTWALGILAVGVRLGHMTPGIESVAQANGGEVKPMEYRAGWLDELVLLAPAVVLLIAVSSQSGFSRHFRYVLPAFPFVFIWMSSVGRVASRYRRTVGVLTAGALIGSIASSLSVYPHSMSYFNELAGGPTGGHRYLLDSNIDWGQDVFYLRDWCRAHPEAKPLRCLFRNSFSDALLGISDIRQPPIGPATDRGAAVAAKPKAQQLGPRPGWYALSIHRIHDATGDHLYFLRFRPVAMAGYSIYIYHITLEQANRVRSELGLPSVIMPEQREKVDSALVQSMAQSAANAGARSRRIAVAIFRAAGGDTAATDELTAILESKSTWAWEAISAADIRLGALSRFDIIIFPGGSATKQAAELGDEGKQAVRRFVRSGGGCMGICAGAFLTAADYGSSLALINVTPLAGKETIPGVGLVSMAARGSGMVKIELTKAGRNILGDIPGSIEVRYSGGPILQPAEHVDLPEYSCLARFRSELWEYEFQRGTMIDAPAIVAAQFGKGRVIAFSPHPETTPGLEPFIIRAVLATARKAVDGHLFRSDGQL